MNKPPPIRDVMELLARIRASTSSPEEQELLAVALNAMLFISSTGQRHAFADFLSYLESSAPPPVVAAFKNREEAESWLARQAEPPAQSLVTIAGENHLAVFHPDVNHRALYPFSMALDEEPSGEAS
ncbi:hypothetical protein F0U62_00585 [Cystobacter fuscus]|uniref:hypothetical protein n=1 Tax=Cystobacter fuscus TaxID=43 RepID=UPI002B2F1785|nr:hypothetical protein F0U62_00585 [Cystobacter fuscus]